MREVITGGNEVTEDTRVLGGTLKIGGYTISTVNKTMAQMQHTFDSLYNKGKQIVITSDRIPKDIPTLTAALCSRFEMGLMVELTPPDLETRIEIIRKLAIDNDLKYTEEAISRF